MYAKLTHLHQTDGTDKSPVVFVRGFPDSPAMFAAYYAEAEHEQPWLRDLTRASPAIKATLRVKSKF